MSAIYVDDVTVDYSEAADDREAPIYGDITLLAGGTETALKKREMPTTSNSIVTVKAAVAENMAKTNATGLNGKSAKAIAVFLGISYGIAHFHAGILVDHRENRSDSVDCRIAPVETIVFNRTNALDVGGNLNTHAFQPLFAHATCNTKSSREPTREMSATGYILIAAVLHLRSKIGVPGAGDIC